MSRDEKIEDIRRRCGKADFRVTVFPDLGFQSLWVSGDEKRYSHRGYQLARFPLFTALVVNEEQARTSGCLFSQDD
jgi:hypothetical protein